MGHSYRNCKYSIHDFVHFKNDFVRVYRVVGYRYQFDFTHESESIEIQYELIRDIDQRIVIAKEEDLSKIAYTTFDVTMSKWTQQSTSTEANKQTFSDYVNSLLDAYNDYQLLHELFSDDIYLVKAAQVKQDYEYLVYGRIE